jgi:DNA sulfur modification protein DndB
MSTTNPAIKGKMGDNDYFMSTMKVADLAKTVIAANEMKGWESKSIEDRLQRELNLKRVSTEIVPYLVQASDRFFNSLVVLVFDPELFEFEELSAIGVNLSAAYKKNSEKLGFLTIEGGQLVALDGQHRLRALQMVLSRKDHEGKPVDGEFIDVLPNDDIAVVFLMITQKEIVKARNIFNKLNRYAKTTTRGDNIITSEDDGYAILTRRLLGDLEPLSGKDKAGNLMVNWRSTTLSARSSQWTTIGAVHTAVKEILESVGHKGWDSKDNPVAPPMDKQDEAYAKLTDWWMNILSEVKGLSDVTEKPENVIKIRQDDSPYSLLMRPVGLVALVKGIVMAIDRSDGELSVKEAAARASKINWSLRGKRKDSEKPNSGNPNSLWVETIITADGRMSAGKEAVALAAELTAYLIGSEFMKNKEKRDLQLRLSTRRNQLDSDKPRFLGPELPEPVVAAKA